VPASYRSIEPTDEFFSLMNRLPNLSIDELSDGQRRVYDLIVSGPRASIRGPFLAWLRQPVLAERAQSLGLFFRFESSLPRHLIEIMILVTAAYWQARFEWFAHAAFARDLGIQPEIIEALRLRQTPTFSDPGDEIVHRFAREMLDSRTVSDSTYEKVVALIGKTGAVELVALLGYYCMVAMTLVTFDISLPIGSEDPFPSAPRPATYE